MNMIHIEINILSLRITGKNQVMIMINLLKNKYRKRKIKKLTIDIETCNNLKKELEISKKNKIKLSFMRMFLVKI